MLERRLHGVPLHCGAQTRESSLWNKVTLHRDRLLATRAHIVIHNF